MQIVELKYQKPFQSKMEEGGKVDSTQGNMKYISEHCLIQNFKKYMGKITESLLEFWAFIKSIPSFYF
jgi:hypothetical protein